MKWKVLHITKQEAATRQLNQAIRLFFERGDMLSVHTLAGASYQVLDDIGKREDETSILRGKDVIRPKRMKEWRSALSRMQHFLKHADRDPDQTHEYVEQTTIFLLFETVEIAGRLLRMQTRERPCPRPGRLRVFGEPADWLDPERGEVGRRSKGNTNSAAGCIAGPAGGSEQGHDTSRWVVAGAHSGQIKDGSGLPGQISNRPALAGDPESDLIRSGLRNKVPKLSVAAGDKKILLLEKDSVAGTIESQSEQVKDSDEVKQLLRGIDEIWTTNTAGLQKENVIFTNKIWPERDRSTICSLDLSTGRFWRVDQ